jgi:hypothetical protein
MKTNERGSKHSGTCDLKQEGWNVSKETAKVE